jgi:DNA-binding PadR family transcriptional regulator
LAELGCLYERPMHPYEMAQTLRHRGKHESVKLNYGSLYSVVESLEKRRMITALETIREGRRPERTVYEITDAGAVELIDWLSELISSPAKEYLQFEAALSFLPVLPPGEAAALLRDRCTALEVRLARIKATRASVEAMDLPRLFTLEDEYQECLVEAELDWTRLLVKEIEQGSFQGLAQWESFHSDRTS